MKLLDFEIDKLTNSIENIASGDSFDTVVTLLNTNDLKLLKKDCWVFDWKREFKSVAKNVYELTIIDNPKIIQGLVSIEDRNDHIFMHLIESAKFNNGKSKIYAGVPGNLVAFACKISFEKGYNGYVSFFAKSKLIEHYQTTVGAKVLFGNQMVVNELSSKILISKNFKQ